MNRKFALSRSGLCSLSAVALLGAAGWAAADDGTTYPLRYKFQAGQSLYYEVENATTIVTRFNGSDETVTNQSRAWKQLRVTSVDGQGGAQLEPVVERVVMSATKDGEDAVTYDSAVDADPPLQFLGVKRTIGQVQARVGVGANGELKKVVPLATDNEALKAAAEKNDPRLNFLVVLPDKPVRIGESWKDRFTEEVTVGKSLKQEVTLQRTYTLTGVQGSVATIKLKTSVVTPVNDPQIEVQLIQRTPSGTIEFDLEQGRILSMRTQIDQTVVGAFGPNSSIAAVTKSSEKLLPGPPDVKTANREENQAK
jgi:hypothetical protein